MSCLPHILAKSNLGKQLGLTKDTAFNTIAEIRELIDIEGFKKFVEQPINKEIKVKSFKTGKGSVYTYLPDGRIQRFKTVENKQYDPQDLIVFVRFRNSEQEQNFLAGVQDRERSGTKVYVIDKQGNKYSKNADIKGKDVVLALVETKTNKVIDTVETKQEPTIGYNTYDERRYVENGEPMRSMHIGNKVTELAQEQPIVEETPHQNLGWARRSDNGYEVSSKGDKRFSAFYAKIKTSKGMKSIEDLYQTEVKGYKTMQEGKGKPALTGISRQEQYLQYKEMWVQFANENPKLMQELAEKTQGKQLTDMFANTDINQARALSEILNEFDYNIEDKKQYSKVDELNPNYDENNEPSCPF